MDARLVKVASFSSVSAQWLPMILKAFSKLYPAIEFEIQTCDFYDQIEELIITGQADCGFLRMPSLKGLQVYPPAPGPVEGHCALRASSGQQRSLSGGGPGHGAGDPAGGGRRLRNPSRLRRNGRAAHVRYIAREDRTILSMVSNGLGISLLPELMVRHSPYPLVVCQPPKAFYRRIAIGVKDEKACPTPPSGLWTTSGPGCR